MASLHAADTRWKESLYVLSLVVSMDFCGGEGRRAIMSKNIQDACECLYSAISALGAMKKFHSLGGRSGIG